MIGKFYNFQRLEKKFIFPGRKIEFTLFEWKMLRINNRVEIWNSILGEMRNKTNERCPKLIDRLIFHLSGESV